MNLEWEQDWLEQFNNRLEELMANYPEDFEYEDLNFGVRINNDREKLRRWFKTFENADHDASKHYFNAARYHGDETGGCLEWTWEIHHRSDFLGLPSDGKTTLVRGLPIHRSEEERVGKGGISTSGTLE